MSNKKTLEFFGPNGEVKHYIPLSARIGDFLAAYPKDKYRVEVEHYDPMACKPGLLALYQAALAAGKRPDEVGLPAISAGDVMVFKATLYGTDDKPLETASALRVVKHYKDWEKGETAARQRLIASLGFGGEVFDQDESDDIRDQGYSFNPPAEDVNQDVCPAPSDVNQDAHPAPSDANEPLAQSHNPSPVMATETPPEAQPAQPAQAQLQDDAVEQIPDRLIRQIAHQARLKNRDIPEVKTVQEAKQALKQLMQA